MKLLFISLFLVLTTSTASAAPVQWVAGNGHYYEAFNTSSVSIGTAIASAEAMVLGGTSGHLVTFSSAAEESFIIDQFGSLDWGTATPSAWIGFTDINVEGNWEWLTGEPVTYTNWHPLLTGTPNGGLNENYAEIIFNFSGAYGWNDLGGNSSGCCEGYIVEWDITAIPEPGSGLLLCFGLCGIAFRNRLRSVYLKPLV